MGWFDWFRGKKAKVALSPVEAFDLRIDTLGARAAALRKSAATLLTVRRDLDRKLDALGKHLEAARGQRDRALRERDGEAAAVLATDQARFERDHTYLLEQKAKVSTDAEALTEAVKAVEAEAEALRRERDGARVQLEAAHVVVQTRTAVDDRVDQLMQLDAARDEVERAHALAEIYREDALAKRARERG
jgi:SMC interacting uncharacterized protein involved in chromosome segregation